MPDYDLLRVWVGGRVGYFSSETDRLYVARLEEAEDGRLEVVEIFVDSNGSSLTTDDLRAVPLRKIEALANQHIKSILIKKTMHQGPDALESDIRRFRRPINADPGPEVSLRLPKRSGTSYPDSFYEKVARAYESLSGEHGPAVRLAEYNRVPVSQVHRWIKEARRRGFLAPGRPGKAG